MSTLQELVELQSEEPPHSIVHRVDHHDEHYHTDHHGEHVDLRPFKPHPLDMSLLSTGEIIHPLPLKHTWEGSKKSTWEGEKLAMDVEKGGYKQESGHANESEKRGYSHSRPGERMVYRYDLETAGETENACDLPGVAEVFSSHTPEPKAHSKSVKILGTRIFLRRFRCRVVFMIPLASVF
jgi:hypothetical protein